ncbi:MAG: hypothetical protein IMZ50_01950 [Candidatus Atribacteria bacterium]|nr:hypothetical protein [Candidatus Atribacteria bacterium]
MNATMQRARRESGLAKYERSHRRKVQFEGRNRLAYLVPGTRESGEWNMHWQRMQDLLTNGMSA